MALMVEQGEIDPEFAFVANMTQAQTDQAMVGLIPIVRIESGKVSYRDRNQVDADQKREPFGPGWRGLCDPIGSSLQMRKTGVPQTSELDEKEKS